MKDANGVEYVMVPRNPTRKMLDAAFNSSGESDEAKIDRSEAFNVYAEMIAAAPPFVPPPVTDEVAANISTAYSGMPVEASIAKDGMQMIAAVQQVLGPALGLVPKEWVADAYDEGAYHGQQRAACVTDRESGQYWFQNSEARKRIDGGA